jgi:uncharacterized protein
VAPQLLSDAELALRNIPERFGDKRAMNLEELDGFLAAMICGPAFTFQPLLQDVFSLSATEMPYPTSCDPVRSFTPLLVEDDHGVSRANDWATGLM